MPTVAQVRSWQPDVIDAAADLLIERRRTLVELQAAMDSGAPPSSWNSAAAEAASGKHRRLWDALADFVAEVSQVAAALDSASGAIARAKAELDAVVAYAHSASFEVDETFGRVSDKLCVPEEEVADRQAICDEIVDRIEQGLRNAEHADAQLAAALRSAAAGTVEGGTTSFSDAATAGANAGASDPLAPPKNASDHDYNAWWNGLSPDEQQQVIQTHPEWIGNTDGIPAWARDKANRELIDDYRADLEREKAELEKWAYGPPINTYYLGKVATVEDKLKGLDVVEDTLALGNRQLLVLDITGKDQLKAAVAYGNVDTADHVAVFTPGFTSNVQDSLANYDRDMRELAELSAAEAEKYGDGGTVATVTWLGYEAPQTDNVIGPDSVVGRGPAERGAKDLAAFLNGIDASRDADPHLTALGHSYGSLTTGLALQYQTGVDDAVVFGSPGLGTSHIEDMDIDAGHLYRIEARQDAVADAGALGMFGIDPSHMDGVTGLSAKSGFVDSHEFGESVGHSEYFASDSMSQHNMAAIVGGAPDRTVEDDGKGFGDFWSWPVPGTY